MSQSLSPEKVFQQLVHGVADGRWDELPRLYADQTHVVHPFDPFQAPPLRSRDELREHFTVAASSAPALSRQPANVVIHETTDPEVIVAEFEYQGHNIDTGQSFAIPCIFVLRVRDGEIVESRDYIDHLTSARARGRLSEFLEELKKQSE